MNISLAVGVGMLIAKWYAYLITDSSVIFSDAAESVVHIFAVWFAWHAVRVAAEPPDGEHHYGHEKITFISAAIEGSLISLAAVVIIISAVTSYIDGVELRSLSLGIMITAGAAVVNAVLGFYLVRTGRRERSLVVEANGQHVMTDVWTSAGAVIGLLLAQLTGVYELDPIIAVLFAANILREGYKLVSRSAGGLMDKTDHELETRAREKLDAFVLEHDLSYHRFRLRLSGRTPHVDFHILFPDDTSIHDAHATATAAEKSVKSALDNPDAQVFSHLEPRTHPEGHE